MNMLKTGFANSLLAPLYIVQNVNSNTTNICLKIFVSYITLDDTISLMRIWFQSLKKYLCSSKKTDKKSRQGMSPNLTMPIIYI